MTFHLPTSYVTDLLHVQIFDLLLRFKYLEVNLDLVLLSSGTKNPNINLDLRTTDIAGKITLG